MRTPKTALFAFSSLLSTSLMLACNTVPLATKPSDPAPAVGLSFDQEGSAKLFTAAGPNGALDFRLWLDREGAARPVPLSLAEGDLVLGAALLGEDEAVVAVRSGEGDRLERVRLSTGEAVVLARGADHGFGLVELGSLDVQDGRARFLASYQADDPAGEAGQNGHTDHAAVAQTVFELDLASTVVTRLDLDAPSARAYEMRRLSGSSSSVQGQVAPGAWLLFPKKLASRPVYGSPYHTGNDLYALDINRGAGNDDLGDGVIAAASGQVVFSGWNTQGYGNLVVVRHSNGLQTYYAHLDKTAVTTGANVYAGQWIGNVGGSGHANMPAHLHFVVRDPALPAGAQGVRAASAGNPMIAFGPSVSGGASACPVTHLLGNVTYEHRSGC